MYFQHEFMLLKIFLKKLCDYTFSNIRYMLMLLHFKGFKYYALHFSLSQTHHSENNIEVGDKMRIKMHLF